MGRLLKGDVTGFDRARLSRFVKQSRIYVKEFNKELGKEYVRVMRSLTPVKTGRAKRSIKLTRRRGGFDVGSDLEYFKFVDQGRKRLVKRDGYFVFEVGGRTVFTKVLSAVKGKFIIKRTVKQVNSASVTNIQNRVVKRAFK